MAAFSGTAGSVVFGTATVDLIKEWSIDFSMSPNETTVFAESWDSFQPGVRTVTGSFSGYKQFGIAGPVQNTAVYAFLAGSVVTLDLYETATKYWDIQQVFFTGFGETVSVKGLAEVTFNFQGIGSATYN